MKSKLSYNFATFFHKYIFRVFQNKITWDFVFDALKSVAVFYDFPSPICNLLYVIRINIAVNFFNFRLLGVTIEETFDEEKSLEHFAFIVQHYFQNLRSATLDTSDQFVDAVCLFEYILFQAQFQALFLSKHMENFTHKYLKNSPIDVFFPITSQQQSHTAFYVLSNHLS